MMTTRAPVLIVGAGPTGMALAIELGTRQIASLVIERNDRVGHAPRAKTTHSRTREHLRRWGIADKLAAASPFGVDFPSNIVFVTKLDGFELARFDNAFFCAPEKNDFYAEHAQWIPQYKLETTLKAHAESIPLIEFRFNTEFLGADKAADGVSARLRDISTGKDYTVEAQFLVGADGARSRVREVIGGTMEGAYGLSRNYNIVFRAPGLAQAHPHGPGIMYWQVNDIAPSLIGPMDVDDLWFFMPTGLKAGASLTDDQAVALIRQTTGIDLPYEILSRDEWVASSLIADRYRDGPIFLAGDACHLHPPFGGYGMNMGVADGVDLGWKLAGSIAGWGGPRLLDSYEVERRAVHRQVIDEAVSNHANLANQLWRPGLEDDGQTGAEARASARISIEAVKRREFYGLGVVLGYCYEHSPIIDYGGEHPTPSDPVDYVPSAAPGRRAPHAWLDDNLALYDLLGPDYTLLVLGSVSHDDLAAARADAAHLEFPLKIVTLEAPRLRQLFEAPLILIRPDQHVAWRGRSWPGENLLRLVSGRYSERASLQSQGHEGAQACQ